MKPQYIIKSVDGNIEGYPMQINNAFESGILVNKHPKSAYIIPSMLEGTGYTLYLHTTPPENTNLLKMYIEESPRFDEREGCHVQTFKLVDRVFTSEVEKQSVVDIGFSILKSEIRVKRNNLLKSSDFTQIADVPFYKSQWCTYRQALRDISSQEGFASGLVTWPEPPLGLDMIDSPTLDEDGKLKNDDSPTLISTIHAHEKDLSEERTLHETTRTQLRNTQTELDVAKIKLLNIEARMQIIESNISKVVV
tara:strand:- start:215 stop:967 length:753 start_codon:yes stop_codon:yes gene_type:complete